MVAYDNPVMCYACWYAVFNTWVHFVTTVFVCVYQTWFSKRHPRPPQPSVSRTKWLWQSQRVSLGCSQHTAKNRREIQVHPIPHPSLFVQGGGRSYDSPCIKCTCWTCVQPWRGDNATPSLTIERQSAIKFYFLQMQRIVSGYSPYVSRQQDCYQLAVCVIPLPMCMWYSI